MVAASVAIPERLASTAFNRGTVRLPEDTKIEVLDTYCCRCRRPFEAVADEPCPAARRVAAAKAHLIGGPSERKRAEDAE